MTRNEAIKLLAREALLMFEHDGTSTLDGDKHLKLSTKSLTTLEKNCKTKTMK